jgi:shikimate dehydrogenase
MVTGQTRVAAIIGSPVAHSLSPVMHNAAFESLDLDWTYVAFDVAPGAADQALAAMRTLRLAGLSVTMPHKEQVAACVDRLDPAAAALGSANTVRWHEGALIGSSTDGDGWISSLAENEVDVRGRRLFVLGAGGAARAIVDAAARAGAASIVVSNRTASKATQVAALAARHAVVGTIDDVAGADIVVNTTSVGMGSGETPLAAALLRPDQVVADIVYHPRRTALLASAEAIGCRTVDGLGMLVHQAVLQQQAWHGRRPDPAVLRAAAETELARR